ncbi:MAG: urate hydroxylase PuuD [Deltaproteobacteria bacterium]
MSEISPILDAIFRWAHVIARITWIGLLYFFNWVNAPLQLVLDGDTKKAVNPELLPRALFWFRWGAAWTWGTGVLLLMLVFYHGKAVSEDASGAIDGPMVAMIAVTFLAVVVYDAMMKIEALKDMKALFAFAIVAVALLTWLFEYVGFSYRGMNIHLGAAMGTAMAFNVWMRIWPAQQKIITAVKEGNKPEAALLALAGSRSKHNTYMSIPLVWTMINAHTVVPWASWGWWGLTIMVAIGFWFGSMFYRQSAKVKGF